MFTKKLYYDDMFLSECEAIVQEIGDNGIVLNQTIAFPEGGGQIGDRGIIYIDNDRIKFEDTKKGVGRVLTLKDFPCIQVDTPIYHVVNKEDLKKIEVGKEVKVGIDINHRLRTTVLHSALHMVLMITNEYFPEKSKIISGCKITSESARIDFFSEEKFTADDINVINSEVAKLIKEDVDIKTYRLEEEPEALMWECKKFQCPCGGTHIVKTGDAGDIRIKRKSVGKTTERLIVYVQNERINEQYYHK